VIIPFNSWGNSELNCSNGKFAVKHRETSNFDIMHKKEKVLHTSLLLSYNDFYFRSN
jgi:hypothetical protein